MTSKLDRLYSGTEGVIDKGDALVFKSLSFTSNLLEKTVSISMQQLENLLDQIYDRLNKGTAPGKAMRYLSLPYSLAIPKAYKYFFHNEGSALLFKPGVHMVSASVGGGKSLLSFVLAEINREKTGLGSYFTSPVEKPRVTEDGTFKYVYHRYINLDDYYDENGKKLKKFNTKKYKIIMKDEVHLKFNPRMNNTKEYKKKYIPQQKDEILMRHGGITHIYKFSQYKKLDSQDMQALTYMHEVSTVKDIPIKDWLETGEFIFRPVMLKVVTFVIDVQFDGSMKRKKVGGCKLAVSAELLKQYDTHAEKHQLDGVPLDYE